MTDPFMARCPICNAPPWCRCKDLIGMPTHRTHPERYTAALEVR